MSSNDGVQNNLRVADSTAGLTDKGWREMSEVPITRGSVPVLISYFPFSTHGPCHPF